MPLDLQDLSPKPDFETMESAQNRIPKLTVRGRTKASSVVPAAIPNTSSIPYVTAPFSEKDSKESLRSSDDNTLSPPTPSSGPTSVAPWDKEKRNKRELMHATAYSDSFTTSTNERHSSETAKQPFRHEVNIVNFYD